MISNPQLINSTWLYSILPIFQSEILDWPILKIWYRHRNQRPRRPLSSQFDPILFTVGDYLIHHIGSAFLNWPIFKIWYWIRNQRSRKTPSSQFHPILLNLANHPIRHLGSAMLDLRICKIWYKIYNQRPKKFYFENFFITKIIFIVEFKSKIFKIGAKKIFLFLKFFF